MTTTTRPTREFPIGPFRESATRWLADPRPEAEHAPPSPAATVMLVRGCPLEVFMIERASTMDFAPSTWVFPGGRVDSQDAAVVEWGLVASLDAAALAARLGVEADAAGAVLVCALRELFEEAGVLLVDALGADDDEGSESESAGPSDASSSPYEQGLDPQAADRDGVVCTMSADGEGGDVARAPARDDREARRRLEAHEMTLADVLGGRRLRADLVAPVDRWVTPPFEQRRFDTWFFTALLPDGMNAKAVSRESQRGRWVRPEAMLAEMEEGHVRLLPPTRIALERLARAADAGRALEQASAAVFAPTRPEALMGADGPYLRAEVNL